MIPTLCSHRLLKRKDIAQVFLNRGNVLSAGHLSLGSLLQAGNGTCKSRELTRGQVENDSMHIDLHVIRPCLLDGGSGAGVECLTNGIGLTNKLLLIIKVKFLATSLGLCSKPRWARKVSPKDNLHFVKLHQSRQLKREYLGT